jgi:hypothetical protein
MAEAAPFGVRRDSGAVPWTRPAVELSDPSGTTAAKRSWHSAFQDAAVHTTLFCALSFLSKVQNILILLTKSIF